MPAAAPAGRRRRLDATAVNPYHLGFFFTLYPGCDAPMNPSSSTVGQQWRQLMALTFAHAVADTYGGIIAPVIIPMRDHYGVSIAMLIFVTSLLGFASNIFQIPVGHLRATWY